MRWKIVGADSNDLGSGFLKLRIKLLKGLEFVSSATGKRFGVERQYNRTVIEQALKEYGKGEVEPKDLRTRRGVEMGRKSNLKQLSDRIREIDGVTAYLDLFVL